jgi:natural product biosynthesis luciferase-like monooxygenase protein
MKFSLFILPCYRPGVSRSLERFYDELAEAVRYADATGWDRVWVSEHHFHYYGGASPNPALLLAAWARETRRIRLGCGVSLLPLNDPVRVAEDYAMLDRLSGGRLDFGVGRGYLPHEFAGRNVAPGDATGRFQEAFEIIAKAWRGERFTFAGRHHRVGPVAVQPTPTQSPPPIWVACSRTRDSFEWAGRNGFGLLMNQYPMSPAETAERFGWYRDAWDGAGRRRAGRDAMMSLFLHVADTEEQAVAEAKLAVQEHANLFRLLLAQDVENTDYVGDESVFRFIAPEGDVATAFRERTAVGTIAQIAERIARYRDIGFTEISFVVRYGALTHDQCMTNIARAGAEVLPRFRVGAGRVGGARKVS